MSFDTLGLSRLHRNDRGVDEIEVDITLLTIWLMRILRQHQAASPLAPSEPSSVQILQFLAKPQEPRGPEHAQPHMFLLVTTTTPEVDL